MPTNIFSPLLPLAVKIAFFCYFYIQRIQHFSLEVSFLSRPLLKMERSSFGKSEDIRCPVT